MSRHLNDLKEVGINLTGSANIDPATDFTMVNLQTVLAFTGYSDFTPITVTAGTTIKDAYLERD